MDLRAVPALLLLTAAVACGGDPESTTSAGPASPPSASATSVSPTSVAPPSGPAPTSSASVPSPPGVPAPSAAASPSEAAATPPPGGGTDTQEPSGEPLTVAAVRVARQEGFDRVVFELGGGDGRPGWRVAYDDTPSRDGSGEAVEVDGQTTLAVVITGIGYPFDTGVDELDEDPVLPGDLQVVTDVVVGSTFEGSYEAFVGVSGERPFTVARLSTPTRVVIDVAHR